LGAWIYCFDSGKQESGDEVDISEEVEKTMKAVSEVVERACGVMWDGTRLAVDLTSANKEKSTVVVEELCLDFGFEYIHIDATGKNEYGEKLGLERAKEALEANEWSASSLEDDDEDGIGGMDDEQAQMNSELWGLKASLLDPDNEGDEDEGSALQIEGMEQMMSQLMAVKGMIKKGRCALSGANKITEMTAGMPEEERRGMLLELLTT
jgi:septum formation inhibitor-activating ATPase MinD